MVRTIDGNHYFCTNETSVLITDSNNYFHCLWSFLILKANKLFLQFRQKTSLCTGSFLPKRWYRGESITIKPRSILIYIFHCCSVMQPITEQIKRTTNGKPEFNNRHSAQSAVYVKSVYWINNSDIIITLYVLLICITYPIYIHDGKYLTTTFAGSKIKL